MRDHSKQTAINVTEIPGASERPSESLLTVEIEAYSGITKIVSPAKPPSTLIIIMVVVVLAVTAFGLYEGISELEHSWKQFNIFGHIYVILGLFIIPGITFSLLSLILKPFVTTEAVVVGVGMVAVSKRGPIGVKTDTYKLQTVDRFIYVRDRFGLKQPQLIMMLTDSSSAKELFESTRPDEKEWMVSVLNVVLTNSKSPGLWLGPM